MKRVNRRESVSGCDFRMAVLRLRFLLLLPAMFALLASCSGTSSGPVPDLILHSGKILTTNDSFDVVEAMAIYDAHIVAVGNNNEIRDLAGERTELLDLQGKTVIPGLIDSHSHPTWYGMHIFRPDLSKVKSLEEMMAVIEAKVRESQPGEWVTNSGFWNEEKLEERRNPTRFDLDAISPNNPVYLGRGHLGVVNTAALKLLSITEKTPSPPGGTIERDPQTGQLTGRLYERALDRVHEAIPPPTHEQLMEAQRQAFKEMAAAGVTSVRSADASPQAMRAFIDLHNRGELTLRTSVTIHINPNQPSEELEEFFRRTPAASGLGDEWLKIWGVKMTADGGTDLAYLRKEYRNRPGFRGQLGGTFENFVNTVKLCNQYDWRVGIHALGDAAIDFVLDVYEAADQESPISEKRWSIEHGYFLHPEHYDRIKKLGLVMHPQTWHFYNIRRNFVANYPEEYAQMTHPYRTLLDKQIPIAGGTDENWNLEPNDQFFYMWVAITRQTLDDEIVGPEHKLTREEALRFHTIWAAYSTFDEDLKGSLEPGKYADLVVLSDDYLTVPEEAIKNITPLLTMVGGEVVFGKEEF